MKERKVYVEDTYSESISNNTSNNIVIFGYSITNFSRYHKIILNKKIEDRRKRLKYFPGALSRDIEYYVNPTLEESEFDVAIIHVSVKDLLNCESDID